MKAVPAVAFVSDRSGTGKTTLLIGVLKLLKKSGYKVATVKHALHGVQIDKKGSDSWLHIHAGADICVIAGAGVLTKITMEDDISLEDVLRNIPEDIDIILVEGFKDSTVSKIEVYRQGYSNQLLCESPRGSVPGIKAVASSVPLDVRIPVLPLDDHVQVCNFIMEHFLNNKIET